MREVVIGGIYRHFKGHVYKVIAVGRDTNYLRKKVVYQNVENDKDIWIRDKDEFLSLVDKEKYKDVEQEYRFELIESL